MDSGSNSEAGSSRSPFHRYDNMNGDQNQGSFDPNSVNSHKSVDAPDPLPVLRDELLALAESLISQALRLMPLGPDKKPLWGFIPQVPEEQPDGTIFRYSINAFWEQGPTTIENVVHWLDCGATGLAAACGEWSDGLYVFDVDVPRFLPAWVGKDEVDAIFARHRLPDQVSGSGGHHVYVKVEGGAPKSKKLAYAKNENRKSGREVAIETIGEGKYIVLPFSIHPDRTYYLPNGLWDGTFRAIPVISLQELIIVERAAKALCEAPLTKQQIEAYERRMHAYGEKKRAAERANRPQRALRQGESVIDRYNEENDIEDVLNRHGYSEKRGRWAHPDETKGSSVIRHRFLNKSVHFSSNDPMGEGCHSPFDIECHFTYSGDVERAVREMAEEMSIDYASQYEDERRERAYQSYQSARAARPGTPVTRVINAPSRDSEAVEPVEPVEPSVDGEAGPQEQPSDLTPKENEYGYSLDAPAVGSFDPFTQFDNVNEYGESFNGFDAPPVGSPEWNQLPQEACDQMPPPYQTLAEKSIKKATKEGELFELLLSAEEATPEMYGQIVRHERSEDKQNLIDFLEKERQPPNSERYELKLVGGYIWPLVQIFKHVGSRMILIQSPTGTGKTYAFANGQFDGILAVPTITIALQTANDYGIDCVHGESVLSELDLMKDGFVKAVVTYDSLPKLRAELESRGLLIRDLVLGIDEIHQFPSAYAYRSPAIDWLTHESMYFGRVIAFTATPSPLLMATFLKPAARVVFQPDKKEKVEIRYFDRDADICRATKTLEKEHKLEFVVVRHDDRKQLEQLAQMKPFAGKCMVFHSKAKESEDGKAITAGNLKKGSKYLLATSLYDCGLSIKPTIKRYGVLITGRAFATQESIEQVASRIRQGTNFLAPVVIAVQSREAKDEKINMTHNPARIRETLQKCRTKEISKAAFAMIVADFSRALAQARGLEYDQLDAFLDSEGFKRMHVYKELSGGHGDGHNVPYYINGNSIDALINQLRDRLLTTGNLIGEFRAQDGRFVVSGVRHLTVKGKDETGKELAQSRKADKEAVRANFSDAHQKMRESGISGPAYVTSLIKGEVEGATEDHQAYAIKVREIQNAALKAGLDRIFDLNGVLDLLEEIPAPSKNKMTRIARIVWQAETPIEALREKAKTRKDAWERVHIYDRVSVGDVLANSDVERLFNEISANGTQATIIADSPKALRAYIKKTFKVKETQPRKDGKQKERVMEIIAKKPYETVLTTIK